MAPAGNSLQSFCRLFGTTRVFEEAVLRDLYPAHQVFVERYVTAVDALEREGYFLAPEAEEPRRAARDSRIGRW